MKNVFFISVVLAGFLFSCTPEKMPESRDDTLSPTPVQPDNNQGNQQNQDPYISVDKSSLSFESDASSQSVSITSNVAWSCECYDLWVTVKKDSPSQLTVSVDANTSSSRNTNIYLTEQGKSTTLATISVNQSKSVKTGGSDKTFTVSGNGKTVKFKMIYVEGGTFTMGATSEQGEDAYTTATPPHSVTLTDGYYIGETEVTQALWYAIMGETPISDLPYYLQWWYGFGEGDNYPAYSISYDACQKFINRLNDKTGEKFRLPTEAEWEYAARGGKKSAGYRYSGSNVIDDVAWYFNNCYVIDKMTREVATKGANELGIYDMSGSLQEWCSDWYSEFNNIPYTNPHGPSTGEGHVIRNGSWSNGELMIRISVRFNGGDGFGIETGLRLAHD